MISSASPFRVMLRATAIGTLAGCLFLSTIAPVTGGEVSLRRDTLTFEGQIAAEDLAKVQSLLGVDPKVTGLDYAAAVSEAKKVKRFRIKNSSGGNWKAAASLGLMLKYAGGADYVTVEIPAGSTCASACALIAMMNKAKVSKRAAVGIHRPYEPETKLATADDQVEVLRIAGLSLGAVRAILGTPPDEMRWLTWKDVKDFGLRWQPTE